MREFPLTPATKDTPDLRTKTPEQISALARDYPLVFNKALKKLWKLHPNQRGFLTVREWRSRLFGKPLLSQLDDGVVMRNAAIYSASQNLFWVSTIASPYKSLCIQGKVFAHLAVNMQAKLAQGALCSGNTEIDAAPGRNIISFPANSPPANAL